MRNEIVNVVGNRRLTGGHFLFSVEAPQQAAQARPGQFAMVRILGRSDVLLRRPLSIFNVVPRDKRPGGVGRGKHVLQFIYKVVGRGTSLMAKLKRGDQVGLLGPLGHGFFEEEYQSQARRADEVLQIAGGIGIAALLLPAKQLAKAGVKQRLFFGARTKDDLVALKKFQPLMNATLLATEDGSAGTQGLVTQPLEQYLSANANKKFLLLACGPWPMLRATVELAGRFGHPCLVSMENRMGCGLGACLGCCVRVQGQGDEAYQRVCKDGPVFWADKIVWD